MGYTVKSFEQILSDMIAWIIANSPNITDLNPGSIIRSYCEAAGLVLEEFYVGVYLGFRRALQDIPQSVFNFERKTGIKSTGAVTFGRTGISGDATIPIGTEVLTVAGLRYLTTAVGIISNGNSTSTPVAVEAAEYGAQYNVPSASIIVLGSTVTGVETVTNANATVGGVDTETDYQYNQRFQAYIEGLGRANIYGLIAGALSVEGITSVSLVEYFPPVANVNVRLYVDDGSLSGVTLDKRNEVKTVIDGDGTAANPGYRAAGVNVEVASPAIVTVDIDLTVTPLLSIDLDQMQIDINTVLSQYVNTLGVGADVVLAELIYAIMGVFGVYNVEITDPTGDIAITSVQVARLGVVTITIGS